MTDPLRDLWDLPLSNEEKRQLSVKLGLLRLEEKDPSVFFFAPTPEDRADVLRSFLKGTVVGCSSEDALDLTYKTVSEYCTPVVPELQGLAGFLLKKSDGFTIRVSSRTYRRVRDYDLQGLFEPSDGDRCLALEEHLSGCILPPPETGVSELSFIQAWDNLINTPLRLFLNVAFSKDRNTNTAMDSLLPDVVGYVDSRFSLWIAEEEPGGTGNLLKELVSKRKWCYKAIPYILGYYASGLAVTLVALYYEEGRVKSRHLAMFNLYDIGDRVRLFMVMSNVGRVLGGLHDMCVVNNENTEFEVVKGITTGKSVRLAGDQVVKGYLTKGTRMKVWKIYHALKGCPNMETCLSRKPLYENGSFKRRIGEYMLRFSPRLNRTARPSTQESLVRALLDVSDALVWLKEKRWIHRDVHWGNVALDDVAGVWMLIDVEEACTFEQATMAHLLNSRVHAPEMLTGCHGSAVDVWGLGHLMRGAKNVPVLNKMVDDVLWELSGKCLAVDPSDRPSIAECRAELESCRTRLTEDSMDCGDKQRSESPELEDIWMLLERSVGKESLEKRWSDVNV